MKYIIFHQDFSKSAGTERVLYNIIEHLLEKGATMTLVLATSEKELVFGIDNLPIELVFLDSNIEDRGKFGLLYSYLKLYKKFKKFYSKLDSNSNYTVLASNHLLAACVFFSTKKYTNLRLVSCEHFSFHVAGRFSIMLRKFFYKNISVVVLTNNDNKVIQKLFNPKICVCIPNAIPFVLRSYEGHDSKVILAIGRYSFQKGFDLLIESFSKISKLYPDWKLVIVGDDYGEGEKMRKLIMDFDLENIELHPSTNKIIDYYRKAAFYVMSSRFEGLPMVLLEAIGHGLPIVSFDCPTGPAEIIDESNGILVEDGNIVALSEAMEYLILNDSERFQYSLGAELKASMFSKSEINSKWDEFFVELWK